MLNQEIEQDDYNDAKASCIIVAIVAAIAGCFMGVAFTLAVQWFCG